MIRDDLSERLIHLTRDTDGVNAETRFRQILGASRINGTSGGIRSEDNCICFSEAPISALGQVIAQKNVEFRYGPYGFMFTKQHLFDQGARPVIYQPDNEFELLPEEIRYRHVPFDLDPNDPIDYTYEREWRLRTDGLDLHHDSVTLIVPTREIETELKTQNHQQNIALGIAGIGIAVQPMNWHFIVLSDLGYNF